MILVPKIRKFLSSFFLKIGFEMMFGYILDIKYAFSCYKNIFFKSRHFGFFAKGLNHDFGQKNWKIPGNT